MSVSSGLNIFVLTMYYEIAFLKVLLICTGDITIQMPYFSQILFKKINLLMRFSCFLAAIPCSMVNFL